MKSPRRDARPHLVKPAEGAERRQVRVPPELSGERIDRAIAALVPDVSRTLARRILGMGGVYLGHQRCRVAGKNVLAGDWITVTWDPEVSAPQDFPLEVLYEDARVVAVVKPAHQLVQGTELGDVGTLAHALAKRFGPDTKLMHRLDAPASGLLLAVKDPDASAALTPQFRRHTIGREYLAVTQGVPREGTCETPLAKDGRLMRPAGPGEAGLPARTDVAVVQTEGGRALVRATLHTGRTHQIRVHLMSLGAPLVGDPTYGGPTAPRMCLHATRLVFQHPDDGREVELVCPPGDDFWAAGRVRPIA